LSGLTNYFRREYCAGNYPYVAFSADERWHQRLYRDPRVDVWLISWLPQQGTQLHDHGGSAGAFTVIDGTLTEAVLSSTGLTDRPRAAGASVRFGARYVHDVRNLSQAPAISVHAYSPPLTSMTFYDYDDGRLTVLSSLPTDDPEPTAEVRAS
jgi:predicted metal-dependent enzyme (double-stranded beta helix superfamily)